MRNPESKLLDSMSNTSKKVQWYTPNAIMRQREEQIRRFDKFENKTRKVQKEEISYFLNPTKSEHRMVHALREHKRWDPKRKKENSADFTSIRKNIFDQEKEKVVSIISSFEYGRPCRMPYDMPTECRRRSFLKEFFSNRSNMGFRDRRHVSEYNKPIFE